MASTWRTPPAGSRPRSAARRWRGRWRTPPSAGRALSLQGAITLHRGDLRGASGLAAEAEHHTERGGEDAARAELAALKAHLGFFSGSYAESLRQAELAVELADRGDDLDLRIFVRRAGCLVFGNVGVGDWPERLAELLQLAIESANRWEEAISRNDLADYLMTRGELVSAEREIERGVALASGSAPHNRFVLGVLTCTRAEIRLLAGRGQAALAGRPTPSPPSTASSRPSCASSARRMPSSSAAPSSSRGSSTSSATRPTATGSPASTTGATWHASSSLTAERLAGPISVAVLDLDRFKSINDRFGHDAGDRVLVRVAALLRDARRSSDLVVRTGGEEFVVLMPLTQVGAAVACCERIRKAIRDERWEEIVSGMTLTASVGVASARDAIDLDSLVKLADRRLYEASPVHRHVFTPRDLARCSPRLMSARMSRAARNDGWADRRFVPPTAAPDELFARRAARRARLTGDEYTSPDATTTAPPRSPPPFAWRRAW